MVGRERRNGDGRVDRWRRGPWRNVEAVEFATLRRVRWFNNFRRLEPIGYVPPAEFETMYYRARSSADALHTSARVGYGAQYRDTVRGVRCARSP